MSPSAQALFVGLKDEYRRSIRDLFAATKARVRRMPGLKLAAKVKAVKQLDDEMKKFLDRVYFPLYRSGDYVLIANRPGQPNIVSYFDSERESNTAKKQLEAAGYTVTATKRDEHHQKIKAAKALESIATKISNASTTGTIAGKQLIGLLDEIDQLIINSLPDRSFRKSFLHRKNTAGYSDDFIRAYSDTMRKSASHIANLKYGDRIDKTLSDMKDVVDSVPPGSDNRAIHEVYTRMRQQEEDITKKTGAFASFAGRAGFSMMLGSLSNFGLNLTQTAINTYPYLGAEYGFTKAGLHLSLAFTQQFSKFNKATSLQAAGKILDMRPRLNQTERDIFDKLFDAKKIDHTQVHEMMDAATNPSNKYSAAEQNIMKVISLPQHMSEIANRQVTALATIRLELARSGDVDKAYTAAANAIDNTHFEYSKENRAKIMTGDMSRVLLMFKQFGQNQAFFWGNTARLAFEGSKTLDSEGNPVVSSGNRAERNKARRQLAAMLGAQFVAAGVLGLPIFLEAGVVAAGVAGFKIGGSKGAYTGIGLAVLAAIASSFGDDDEEKFETEVKNWIANTFGEDLEDWISHGFVPRGLAARLDASELLFKKPKDTTTREEWFKEAAKVAAGPFGGVVMDVGEGTAKILEGDVGEGARQGFPLKQAKDMLQAAKWIGDDYKIKLANGEVLTGVTAGDAIVKMIGFNPSVAVKSREYYNAMKQLDKALTKKKSDTLEKAIKAYDKEDIEKTKEIVFEYNAQAPVGYNIEGSTVGDQLKEEYRHTIERARVTRDEPKLDTLEKRITYRKPPPRQLEHAE